MNTNLRLIQLQVAVMLNKQHSKDPIEFVQRLFAHHLVKNVNEIEMQSI